MQKIIFVDSKLCFHGNLVEAIQTHLDNRDLRIRWKVVSVTSDGQGAFLVVIES